MTREPLSGCKLGNYDVGPLVGSGGMGEVYRGRDTALNRDVAIKVLLPAVAADQERLARFNREAQVLASLNHPNIAQNVALRFWVLICAPMTSPRIANAFS
jgi:eukaryotic-like serine/threonine-protein kinase